MSHLTISLPESMQEFLDAQVSKGGYASVSEYVQSLIREAQRREAEEDLEAKLLEGLDSGPGIEATSEYWEQKRTKLIERHKGAERA